jgi:cytochrome b pre-mRNA-processing protein 3
MPLFGLLRSHRYERTGFALYGAAVAAARDPYFYATLGVPDTMDGRFDLVGLHAFLLIRRLDAAADKQGKLLAQAVFDAMFADMDITLREIGVGDMSIGKRVRAMWEAFNGRCAAYQAALTADDRQALAEAIGRNVWRGGPAGDAWRLSGIVRAQDTHLAGQTLAALKAGEAEFLDAAAVVP